MTSVPSSSLNTEACEIWKEALAAEIQKGVDSLPASQQLNPQDGELVNNPSDGYVRLQN